MTNKNKRGVTKNTFKFNVKYLILFGVTFLLLISIIINRTGSSESNQTRKTNEITTSLVTPGANKSPGKLYEITDYVPKVFTNEINLQSKYIDNFRQFSDESISIIFNYPSHWDSRVMKNGQFLPFNQEYGNVYQSTVILNKDVKCMDITDDCRFLGIIYWEGYDEHFANTFNSSLCTKFTLNNISGCVYSFGEGDFYMEYFDFMDKNNKGRYSIGLSANYRSDDLKKQVLQMLSTVKFK